MPNALCHQCTINSDEWCRLTARCCIELRVCQEVLGGQARRDAAECVFRCVIVAKVVYCFTSVHLNLVLESVFNNAQLLLAPTLRTNYALVADVAPSVIRRCCLSCGYISKTKHDRPIVTRNTVGNFTLLADHLWLMKRIREEVLLYFT